MRSAFLVSVMQLPTAGISGWAVSSLKYRTVMVMPLVTCIRSADHAVHIRAVHKFLQDAKLLFDAGRHQILPLFRQEGQICDAPLDILGIVHIGRSQFHQMTNAPAYQIAVALKVAILTAGCTEDFGIGHCDEWFFRHD